MDGAMSSLQRATEGGSNAIVADMERRRENRRSMAQSSMMSQLGAMAAGMAGGLRPTPPSHPKHKPAPRKSMALSPLAAAPKVGVDAAGDVSSASAVGAFPRRRAPRKSHVLGLTASARSSVSSDAVGLVDDGE
ncbi:hypothetical protein EON66_04555 [archaeon]|nr:MAG: hypothetical protein EON66_04555 [archaeon]